MNARWKDAGNDSLVGLELMDLLDMDRQTAGCVQTTRTEVAFEVLGFLVLH